MSYTGNVNKDYIFKFKKNYLETTISKNDSIADIVVMLITDSVSTIHGEAQNSINDLFNSNIYNFKFSDGISYTDKTDKFIVKINLDNYIKNRTSE